MYSERLLNKIESLIKSYEGKDKLGEVHSYSISHDKRMGKEGAKYKLTVVFRIPSKGRLGSSHFIKTHEFENPGHCYLSMKEQLKFEVESFRIKRELEDNINVMSDMGELELLQIDLQDAIDEEDYEEAEKIKEKIENIKS